MMRAPGPPPPPPGATDADWALWVERRAAWRKAEDRALIAFAVFMAVTTSGLVAGFIWFAWGHF